ncbi:NAD(P)-dependent glycerol-3-phosphate dehydrogenase [Legionella geestiana]|uniref:NAD(P)H-dependent glycerol-3-phosphate dehydrogenase n=1 Tax=Legionella geestiana TaxID=45065 RepID=UPI0010928721|nr:NAD(P)H-dependent glycerol-3-phosphate dehydrogenase [Legionella geestiana]QDQ40500.1 NAD(P)-dependent glycerol-3-phosphate dehydrogenase [Legionella geestiana]
MQKATIAMLGAGSFGTAIAIHMAKAGHNVRLWGHRAEHVRTMMKEGCNARFLPHHSFPPTLTPCLSLTEALEAADVVMLAIPSRAFAALLAELPDTLKNIVWLTKGLDPSSHRFLSDLVFIRYGRAFPAAMLSGPSFAREVANGLPTAVTLVGNDMPFLHFLHPLLHHGNFRVYLSQDLRGVQWCGAVKNVLAIACGVSDGLGYGANAKAAIITRGLAEMRRLGMALGAQPDTFLGLSGVGDLVLTCTDDQSRNRRFGLALGRGETPAAAEAAIGQVVEGKDNAQEVCALARAHQIDMPVCTQIEALLEGRVSPAEAAKNLLARAPQQE